MKKKKVDRQHYRDRRQSKFQEHYDYMQSVTPELIALEDRIEEIKGSKEWKRAFQYFQTLYNRGKIKERPTKQHGYKIEIGVSYVQIADIEDLLTPEQIEEIKKRL